MRFQVLLPATLAAASTATAKPHQRPLHDTSNLSSLFAENMSADHPSTSGFTIPSVHESAVMARRILHLTTVGTIVTTFSSGGRHPEAVNENAIGLMEYFADCETEGNPTLLAIDIATPFRNYAAGSNISLSVAWWPETKTYYAALADLETKELPTPHTPVALPRFSLHGHLEDIDVGWKVPYCFMKSHPDSVMWQPGNDVSHRSKYVRLVVDEVYWLGGFGDRARIGWLPIDEYKNVTAEEIQEYRLPGEKDEKKKSQSWWREWL